MNIDHASIESVAPDQASLNAARKLLKKAKWPLLGEDKDQSLLWGSCQGSGATPYSVTVARSDLGAKCSCPSRKFPCKHAIALMWWYADEPESFITAEVPEFVSTWLSRRRGGAAKPKDDSDEKASKSIAASATTQKTQPKDPARAAAAAARAKAKREASIVEGLDELDTWICDQLETGLGGFGTRAQEQCRLMSQRLVDAKAGGLATRVQDLASDYFATPQQQRPDYLIKALGSMHLLSSAYRRLSRLPPLLAADVRRHVGWTMTREQLLNSKEATRLRSDWTVVANRSVNQRDGLVRQETWLCTGAQDGPTFAVLQDFVPAAMSSGSAPAVLAGHSIDAELVFYPSSTPLRAQVAQQHDISVTDALGELSPLDVDIHQHYQDSRAIHPWLDSVPVVFEGELKSTTDQGLWLDTGREQLKLANESLSALYGERGLRGVGLYSGHDLYVLALHTTLGTWWSVPQ